MCGRFQLTTDPQQIIDAFQVVVNELDGWEPRFNVAPSLTVPIVRMRDGGRTLSGACWGLVPHWAQDTKSAFKMINARAETVAQLSSYRGPIRRTRCIVPVDGWYEWRAENGVKWPYHVRVDDIASFAGIWTWNPTLQLLSCSIITTDACAAAAEIHDRMPVVLPRPNVDAWLDPAADLKDVLSLLRPYEGNDLRTMRVTRYVSNARNEGPECLTPA
jgi:putative SOS response-associated peptidase YedK